jgi:hypothetical protein
MCHKKTRSLGIAAGALHLRLARAHEAGARAVFVSSDVPVAAAVTSLSMSGRRRGWGPE